MQLVELAKSLISFRTEIPPGGEEGCAKYIRDTLADLHIEGAELRLDRFEAGRAAFRLQHLTALRPPLEQSCVNLIAETGTEGPEEHASWFMQLARAVLPQSPTDAAAYFAQAVEAVSKFGDEMVERWEALVAVAKKAAESQKSVPELAYRFVRCAEVIGETVVREKYWDRDDVFRVAVRLDAPGAFAALSRWRDRGVGWFGEQLHALATESVKRGLISPLLGWCLSGFKGCNHSAEYEIGRAHV